MQTRHRRPPAKPSSGQQSRSLGAPLGLPGSPARVGVSTLSLYRDFTHGARLGPVDFSSTACAFKFSGIAHLIQSEKDRLPVNLEIPTDELIGFAADRLADLTGELLALYESGHVSGPRFHYEISAQAAIVSALVGLRRVERNVGKSAPEIRAETVKGVH